MTVQKEKVGYSRDSSSQIFQTPKSRSRTLVSCRITTLLALSLGSHDSKSCRTAS